jgi:tetratricopeptide (TPR) repeat protein
VLRHNAQPAAPILLTMTLQQALELHQAGRHEEAEHAYRQHLAENPQDADALHLLGVLRQQRHDSDGALELIRQALALAPERAQYHLSLGGTLLRTGDLAAARASFERALEIDPNSIEAHGLLGHLALQAGDHDDAENRFRIGRRADVEDPLILFGLGSIHLDRGDPVNAAKFLGRAAQLKPDDAAIQTAFGRALFMQSAFGLAEQAFVNALKLRPDLGVAKLFLARTRMRQNKLEAARELFAELLAAGVQTQFAHAGLGDVARHQGRFVHALKHYRRVLAVDPGHVGASVASASCMEQIGDLDGATQFLAAGLRHAPQADALRRPLAELLDRLGRGEEAAQVRAAGAR